MIKWLSKQFIWGQIYHWAKDRLSGILFTAIILFLIIYFHNEYLKYIEFKEKNTGNYIGVSFLIKNTLILIVTFSYFYFYKFNRIAGSGTNACMKYSIFRVFEHSLSRGNGGSVCFLWINHWSLSWLFMV